MKRLHIAAFLVGAWAVAACSDNPNGDRSAPKQAASPEARRSAFVGRLLIISRKGVEDARRAAAQGRLNFVDGKDAEKYMGWYPGFITCYVPNRVTVTDWVGSDSFADAARSVYAEAYNMELFRLRPETIRKNCAAGRGKTPRTPGPEETQLYDYQHRAPVPTS